MIVDHINAHKGYAMNQSGFPFDIGKDEEMEDGGASDASGDDKFEEAVDLGSVSDGRRCGIMTVTVSHTSRRCTRYLQRGTQTCTPSAGNPVILTHYATRSCPV